MEQLPFYVRHSNAAGGPLPGDHLANQAALELIRGRPLEAMKAASQALVVHRGHPTASANLASALMLMGQVQEARALLSGLDPDYASAGLARLAIARGDGTEAVQQAVRAVARWGCSFSALEEMARQSATRPGSWLHRLQYAYEMQVRRWPMQVGSIWCGLLSLLATMPKNNIGPQLLAALLLVLAAIASSRPVVVGRMFQIFQSDATLSTRMRGLLAWASLVAVFAFGGGWALACGGSLNQAVLCFLPWLVLWLEPLLGGRAFCITMAAQLAVAAGYFGLRYLTSCPLEALTQIPSLTLLFDLCAIFYGLARRGRQLSASG
ncbi:tetratricopeptide repeat protein [bacterium]|nr:tetratricopeptide repeat protein [bacterium]